MHYLSQREKSKIKMKMKKLKYMGKVIKIYKQPESFKKSLYRWVNSALFVTSMVAVFLETVIVTSTGLRVVNVVGFGIIYIYVLSIGIHIYRYDGEYLLIFENGIFYNLPNFLKFALFWHEILKVDDNKSRYFVRMEIYDINNKRHVIVPFYANILIKLKPIRAKYIGNLYYFKATELDGDYGPAIDITDDVKRNPEKYKWLYDLGIEFAEDSNVYADLWVEDKMLEELWGE